MRFGDILIFLVVSVLVGGVEEIAVEEAMDDGGMLLLVMVVVVGIEMQGMGALGSDWMGLLRPLEEATVMEGSHGGVCSVAERRVEMCVACLWWKK